MTVSIRSRGAALSALTAVLVIGALAGCTGGDQPAKTSTPKPTKSASAAADPGITQIEHPAGSGTDGKGGGIVGAKDDTKVTACEPSGDAWKVAGTVTNSSDAAADYRLYVSLLNKSNDTRALVEVDVNGVAAGAKKSWSKDIGTKDENLTCVIRTERYAA